jgi:hypothetical protein
MMLGSTLTWHPTIDTSALLAAQQRLRFLLDRPVTHCSVPVLPVLLA